MGTLECLATGPLTESLEELAIEEFDLPLSELPHLYALRRLRALELDCSYSARLDDATIDSLTPPTALLPALTSLSVPQWRARDKDIERKGASFEWMQKRMTQ